jgi:hypothetical protein
MPYNTEVTKGTPHVSTTPEAQFKEAFETLYRICEQNSWGDPFSYARSREIHIATTLGHSVADTYSGADAFDENGLPVEYKSTISDSINGRYAGISVQPTWEDQERYLIDHKLGCYSSHFIARYSGGNIVEIWKMSSDDVLAVLLPKLHRDYDRKISGNYKDPRLSAQLTKGEITRLGARVV